MMEDARRRFLAYDMSSLTAGSCATDDGAAIVTRLFGQTVRVDKATGRITVDGEKADFSQTLSVYDWLCDRKPYAVASGIFCPVSSLPGVVVSGSGLNIAPRSLAEKIDHAPQEFCRACEQMGGTAVQQGDLGYRLEIFPGLPVDLKFYFADEEFPASLTLLWDRNILQFVRYETVYYLAGCLQKRLLQLM